jgi:hypothetical protein
MELNQYQKNDLLERAMAHAERAQVARRNFLSAKSQNKMKIFKGIEERETQMAEQLMAQAGIPFD